MYFYVLLAAFIIRVIIFSSSIADAICMIGLISYLLIDKYLKSKELQKKYDEDFKNIQENLTKADNLNKEIIADLRNSVDSLKIAVGFKRK